MLLVVLWRLRYTLRLRDLAELFLERGIVFTHETIRDREARCAPLVTARLSAKRRGTAGTKWQTDETDRKVDGRWCYRYRAIGREGSLVEALLREQRDMDAAQRCFARALDTAVHTPAPVTTEGHDASPRAIRATLGPAVQHRTSRYKNKRIEQDHRSSKQRLSPCAGSAPAPRRRVSARPARSGASTSGPSHGAASTSPSRSGGASSRTAGRPS